MKAKITVVITSYNLQSYIADCLNELLEQTFQDFVILLVDDCSKDSTKTIIDSYKHRMGERLKTIYLDINTGSPALTRNIALDSGLIESKYVVFLDGDDRVEKNFLEKLYNTAVSTKADVSICAYNRVEEESKTVLCTEMNHFPPIIELPPIDDGIAYINGSLWNKLFLVKSIGDLRVPNFKVGEDFAFQQNVFTHCKRIAFTKDVLIHYNVRKNSVISNTQQDTIFKFAEEFVKTYTICKDSTFKNIIELTAFIHIGLSMAIRANDNADINISEHLKWTRNYFNKNFNLFSNSNYLKLRSLKKRGIKGLAIWICLGLYKMHSFKLFLIIYRFVTKTLHIDFKF